MTESMFPDLPPEEPGQSTRRPRRGEDAKFVEGFMYLLTAPHLAYAGYEDTLPRREEIGLQRLAHGEEIFEQEMATEFEAMLYLSTASLAAPMLHDWVGIYMWLFKRWNPEAAALNDIVVGELDRNQVDQLNRFRRWMYRTQMNYMKAKDKAANQEEVKQEQQELEIQRPRMFE